MRHGKVEKKSDRKKKRQNDRQTKMVKGWHTERQGKTEKKKKNDAKYCRTK